MNWGDKENQTQNRRIRSSKEWNPKDRSYRWSEWETWSSSRTLARGKRERNSTSKWWVGGLVSSDGRQQACVNRSNNRNMKETWWNWKQTSRQTKQSMHTEEAQHSSRKTTRDTTKNTQENLWITKVKKKSRRSQSGNKIKHKKNQVNEYNTGTMFIRVERKTYWKPKQAVFYVWNIKMMRRTIQWLIAIEHFLHAVRFAKHILCIIIVRNPFLQMRQVEHKEILRHVKDQKQFWIKSKDTGTQKQRCWSMKTCYKH